MHNQQIYWLALSRLPSVGPVKAAALLKHFRTPGEIFSASARELVSVDGITARDARSVTGFSLKEAEQDWKLMEQNGFSLVTRDDPAYPALLRDTYNPPIALYVWGTLSPTGQEHCLGVVGTRLCSPYGRIQADRLSAGLAELGFTVVSGMARGVDTAAHHGALRARGRTVAVLGSGLLSLYPPENRGLAEKIAANGAVISEFPLRTQPDRTNFPRRNRIISGMSAGVLVVEAGVRSGALITADAALEQGREVFVLPGPIDQETSAGTNQLIKEGAVSVTCLEDILENLPSHYTQNRVKAPAADPTPPAPTAASEKERVTANETLPQTENPAEGERELNALFTRQKRTLSVEEIALALKMDLPDTNALLTRMEIKGLVVQTPGKRFRPA